MGSLRDALAAAGLEDRKTAATPEEPAAAPAPPAPAFAMAIAKPADPKASVAEPSLPPPELPPVTSKKEQDPRPSAAEAAREARGGRNADEVTTRVVRAHAIPGAPSAPARTQLIRGKVAVKRAEFHQDPVVGWLVVVGGPGLGAFRPVFEGNNTIGRASSQRIPIDFGDDTISAEEQAYLRYDGAERKFLLVPNLAKTNIVSINDKRPTAAVELNAMDLITIGRTQLVFMPFCGPDFDWSELGELKP
jgi:hypothetical protein